MCVFTHGCTYFRVLVQMVILTKNLIQKFTWTTQDIKGPYPALVSLTPQSEPPVACWFLLMLHSPPQTEE